MRVSSSAALRPVNFALKSSPLTVRAILLARLGSNALASPNFSGACPSMRISCPAFFTSASSLAVICGAPKAMTISASPETVLSFSPNAILRKARRVPSKLTWLFTLALGLKSDARPKADGSCPSARINAPTWGIVPLSCIAASGLIDAIPSNARSAPAAFKVPLNAVCSPAISPMTSATVVFSAIRSLKGVIPKTRSAGPPKDGQRRSMSTSLRF